jgi:hypothetical protein
VTDTKGERFFVLYQEDEKSEIRNPKSETNPNIQNLNTKTENKEDPKISDIRKQIDAIKTDGDGHTIINQGETHEIERDDE